MIAMNNKRKPIRALFTDVGGVLLTNGWDKSARLKAIKVFHLEKEVEDRHSLMGSSMELAQFSLEDYLSKVIFYKKRAFTRAQFRKFMFDQSKPYKDMIQLIRELKIKYDLKTVVVSNETLELNIYRIQKFELNTFIDFFISSCFVKLRKPDPKIFKMALDVAQVPVEQVVLIDDRLLFVEIAQSLGIKGIHHVDYRSTHQQLEVIMSQN